MSTEHLATQSGEKANKCNQNVESFTARSSSKAAHINFTKVHCPTLLCHLDIWGFIWQHTVEKSQTNAINVKKFYGKKQWRGGIDLLYKSPLSNALMSTEYTVEKSQTNATNFTGKKRRHKSTLQNLTMLLCQLESPLGCQLIKRIVLQLHLCDVGHLRKLSCSIIIENYCDGRPPPQQLRETHMARGVRYIDENSSKADKSAFLKLSATNRYRKIFFLKLSKNYWFQKMHQIWSDNYMKSQSIRN